MGFIRDVLQIHRGDLSAADDAAPSDDSGAINAFGATEVSYCVTNTGAVTVQPCRWNELRLQYDIDPSEAVTFGSAGKYRKVINGYGDKIFIMVTALADASAVSIDFALVRDRKYA